MSDTEGLELRAVKPSSGRIVFWTGAIIVAAGLASYFLFYWNHFVGYRAGGGQFIAWSWMMNNGHLPYKDFFCPVPIIYLLRGSILLSLFDDHYISLRACALIERTLMGVLIYVILSKFFPKRVAALPALVTVVTGSSEAADPIDVYTQEALLFSACSIFLVISSCKQNIAARQSILLAVLAGVAAGLSLFTKQTIGFGCAVSAPVAASLCLWRLDGLSQAKRFALSYLTGLVLCIGAFAGGLAMYGILTDFFVQAFIKGPAAKAGHATDFIQRFFDSQTFYTTTVVCLGLINLAIFWKKLKQSYQGDLDNPPGENVGNLAATAAVVVAALAFGSYMGYNWGLFSPTVNLVGKLLRGTGTFFTYFGLLALNLLYTYRVYRGTINRWEMQAFVYSSVAFFDATMVCLSFPFYEAVMNPGFALVLALILNKLRGIKLYAFYFFGLVIIGSTLTGRLHCPFLMEDFTESPVSIATQPLKCSQMAGFLLPADMANFLDGTVEIVRDNTKPEDFIYVYPDGSLIYPLTHKLCQTFAMSPNMDTTPNAVAEADAKLLLEHPPKVLVYYRSTDATMKSLEKIWRQGKISGNRKLMEACDQLIKSFRLVKKFPFACKDGEIDIEVYVRNN